MSIEIDLMRPVNPAGASFIKYLWGAIGARNRTLTGAQEESEQTFDEVKLRIRGQNRAEQAGHRKGGC
jgi:hypothetical protein